jgi:hypothetical protein
LSHVRVAVGGRELFANRFEPDGDAFIFRANLRAPGYRVDKSFRDRMIAEFGRRIVWSTWLYAGLTVAGAVGVIWFFVSRQAKLPDVAVWGILAIAAVPLVATHLWLWNAPVRALRAQVPVAPGRSKDAAKQVALKRLTWRQLGVGVLMAPIVLFQLSSLTNLLVGWSRLWLVAFAAYLVLIAVQAVRKLRMDQQR